MIYTLLADSNVIWYEDFDCYVLNTYKNIILLGDDLVHRFLQECLFNSSEEEVYEEDLEVIKVSDLFDNFILKNVYGKKPKTKQENISKIAIEN